MYYSRNILINAVLIVICVFLIMLSFSSFRNLRKVEFEFNEKKAALIKENLDMKDRINALQEMVSRHTDALNVLEKDKKSLDEQLYMLKLENEKMAETYAVESEVMKRKKLTLKKRITALENTPLMERIKEAAAKENNDNMKKVLEDTIKKIELVKAGKPVNLEPIIVTKPGEESAQPAGLDSGPAEAPPVPEKKEKKGVILSIDRKNNLIVMNFGRKEDVKEGDRCRILKDGQDIAEAEVMSVRYRIAAAFVDDILYKYSINDIKEGYVVVVQEK